MAFAGAAAGVAAAAAAGAAGLASVAAAFFPRCVLAAGDAAGLASGDVAGEASVAAAFLPLAFLAFAGDSAGEAAGLGVGAGSAAFTAKGAATNAVAMIRVIRERIFGVCSKINPAKARWFRYFSAVRRLPHFVGLFRSRRSRRSRPLEPGFWPIIVLVSESVPPLVIGTVAAPEPSIVEPPLIGTVAPLMPNISFEPGLVPVLNEGSGLIAFPEMSA